MRENQARLRAVLASSLDCIVMADAHGRLLEFNAAAERTFGYGRDEVIGRAMLELLVAPPFQGLFRRAIDRHLSVGDQQLFDRRIELSAVRKGGQEFPIEAAISVARHNGGSVFTAVLHDITERRGAQQRLIRQTKDLQRALDEVRRVRERERQMLASIPSVFIGLDDDGRVTHWNPPAERQFEVPSPEAAGKALAELRIGWPCDRLLAAIEECSECGEQVRIDDLVVTKRNGTERTLGFTINRIVAPDNSGRGVVLVGADVTERKSMESQLMLAQKMESIGRLAAGIAHEINTPTQYVSDNTRFLGEAFRDIEKLLSVYERLRRVVEGEAAPAALIEELDQILEDADVPFLREEIPKAIEQSREGLRRVAEIVGAMKQFSHPDQNELELADLNQAIKNTVTVTRNEWKYVADMDLDLDPDLPAVPCLVGPFNQAILNLIVNAAQAIAASLPPGFSKKGTIRIATRRRGDELEIRISDTGGGIARNIINKIFDPFFTTKKVGKGTGQGLAIVHNIVVERHGGTVEVESEPGHGAAFILRLPLDSMGQPAVSSP